MRWRAQLAGVSLVLLVLGTYLPALGAGFVWDDDDYVTENETLRDAAGLVRIWTEPTSIPQWYPLVHTTYWIEHALWGFAPLGYHLTNVLLHAACAVLLWRLLERLRVPGAWLAAAVFAVHPVHVETVAWITERKNVLSGALYLGAAHAWLAFVPLEDGDHGPGRRGGRPGAYLLCLALFAGALLAKTVTASLPAALLVVTWWKRGAIGWRRDVVPLLPLFALGAGLGLHTAHLERVHVGASGPDWDLSVLDRSLVAGRAMWFYLGKLAWPHPLVFVYPRWRIDPSSLAQLLYPIAALATLLALWLLRGRIGRGPLAAALLFGGSLVPVSGFFDVYPMRFSFVADHFQYLPSIAPIALGAALWTRIGARATLAQVGPTLTAGLLATLAALAWRQQADYADQRTLWTRTLAKNPDAWIAHDNLGYFAQKDGDIDAAVRHFQRAAELRPADPNAHNTLGTARFFAGDLEGARAAWERALAIDPRFHMAERNLGTLAEREDDLALAERRYERALAIEPGDAESLVLLANLLFRRGELDRAAELYRRALAADPSRDDVRGYLGELERRRSAPEPPR